jgi:hypothetical protein
MDCNDFLTERDRKLIEATAWTKRRDFGLGARPAVLVIDDYYSALGLPRAPVLDIVDEWSIACGEDGWAAIDQTVPLLDTARANEIPIVSSPRRRVRYSMHAGRWSPAAYRSRSAVRSLPKRLLDWRGYRLLLRRDRGVALDEPVRYPAEVC